MKVITLDNTYLEAFFTYCKEHRYDHDESYLYEEDLEEFHIGPKNPTYLLMEDVHIIGVLSLMLTDYFIAAKKSRIRIFHCKSEELTHYEQLLSAMDPLPNGVSLIEAFMPNRVEGVQNFLKTLSFTYYRTSYVMVRKNQEKPSVEFPDGYDLKDFRYGKDEVIYAHIRNTAFSALKGSETPMTEAMVQKLTTENYNLENGTQILWYKDTPVGVLNMIEDEDQNGVYSFVAPIALLPEYQGKGLGTQLLRAGIAMGFDQNYDQCMLCVNAENEQALSLYTKQGFEIDEAISVFRFTL